MVHNNPVEEAEDEIDASLSQEFAPPSNFEDEEKVKKGVSKQDRENNPPSIKVGGQVIVTDEDLDKEDDNMDIDFDIHKMFQIKLEKNSVVKNN